MASSLSHPGTTAGEPHSRPRAPRPSDPGENVGLGPLARRAGTGTNLAGMQRWGYITLAPAPAGATEPGRRAEPPQPRAGTLPQYPMVLHRGEFADGS